MRNLRMLMKRILQIAAFCLVSTSLHAQDDFCDAVNTIMRDAPTKFHNSRGKQLVGQPGAGMWESMIKVPGTISARFISSMGTFYEGALFAANTKEGMLAAYNKWKNEINGCLSSQGYKISTQDNFYPGMGEFKKVVWMQEIGKDLRIGAEPPHVTLEAQYSKETGRYALVMFIYER